MGEEVINREHKKRLEETSGIGTTAMADAHQSRREDMQAEAPGELESREG